MVGWLLYENNNSNKYSAPIECRNMTWHVLKTFPKLREMRYKKSALFLVFFFFWKPNELEIIMMIVRKILMARISFHSNRKRNNMVQLRFIFFSRNPHDSFTLRGVFCVFSVQPVWWLAHQFKTHSIYTIYRNCSKIKSDYEYCDFFLHFVLFSIWIICWNTIWSHWNAKHSYHMQK